MKNQILCKRICKLISMTYAIQENEIENAFEKLQSIDRLIELVESNQLQSIVKECKQ